MYSLVCCIRCVLTFYFVVYVFIGTEAMKTAGGGKTPSELVLEFQKNRNKNKPLANTVLYVPEACCSDDISFVQKATGCRVNGLHNLREISLGWDRDFQSDLGVNSQLTRVSTVSEDTILVNWNVTWVPPTSLWLESLGKALQPTVRTTYVSYKHLSMTPSTFSWNVVGRLFSAIISKKELRVPVACIDGKNFQHQKVQIMACF